MKTMTMHRRDNPNDNSDPEHDFRCLVQQYQRRITVFATRMLGGDAAAGEDVAQDTFLALWRQRIRDGAGSVCPMPDHPDRYLLRIAHNRCIDLLRVRRESVLINPEQDGAADTQTNPENATQARSLGDAVRDAVALLPEGQRSVFILSHYDGLRYREIADLLDCPIGTVASRKSQAVTMLRLRLKAWGDSNENENHERTDASE